MESDEPARSIAEAVKCAIIEAALAAYEDAGEQGLCEAGRWECAVDAMRSIDAEKIARAAGEKGGA